MKRSLTVDQILAIVLLIAATTSTMAAGKARSAGPGHAAVSLHVAAPHTPGTVRSADGSHPHSMHLHQS